MDRLIYPFWIIASRFFLPRYNTRMQFLQAQISMLRRRIGSQRIMPTPEEKAELLRIGNTIDHNINDLLEIVKPATYRRWLNQKRKGANFKHAGRPRINRNIRDLVHRMALKNTLWGYKRIVGEMKKLGYHIGATSVKRILEEFGIYPAPKKARKQPPIPWTQFVHANLESMIACDFFTKPIYTLSGKINAFVLVFIHLRSRKVFCSPVTYTPNSVWVIQQARNATLWLNELGIKPQFLIRDGDRKFPDKFNEFWKTAAVRCIRIPPKSPRANAFAESFIGNLKRECLNFFICFSRSQLDYIVRCWVKYYNTERPHRGIGMNNQVLDESFVPQTKGTVCCKKQLGGIFKSYYREAA